VPIYEYLCENCGRVTEVMQKVTDKPPAACAECGGKRLAKLVSRTAFQLKGGGWYADLYGSPKKKDAAAKPASEAASSPAPPDAGAGKGQASPGKAPDKASGKKPPAKKA
jgi:putative FmdB family regulatory protein